MPFCHAPVAAHSGGSLLTWQLSQVRSLRGSSGSEQSQGRVLIMPERQGTILKKCKCANQERCGHKWTLRYWADGRQREASFADELDGNGRPRYGSGRRLAQDAQLKIAHDKRARVFIDPKLGSARFGDECEKWITRHPGTDLTREAYRNILHAHVGPVFGDRTMASVAQARDDVLDLLTVRLGEGSNSRRKIARALITGVLDEGVVAGKITLHRCGGIVLPDNGGNGHHDDFVFPSHAQLVMLANGTEEPPGSGIKHPLTGTPVPGGSRAGQSVTSPVHLLSISAGQASFPGTKGAQRDSPGYHRHRESLIPAGPPYSVPVGWAARLKLCVYLSRTPLRSSFVMARAVIRESRGGLSRRSSYACHVVRIAFGLLSSVTARVEPARAGT
jgi:hypothetical protein